MLQAEASWGGHGLLLRLSLLAKREGKPWAHPERIRGGMLLRQGQGNPWLLKRVAELPALSSSAEALCRLREAQKW